MAEEQKKNSNKIRIMTWTVAAIIVLIALYVVLR